MNHVLYFISGFSEADDQHLAEHSKVDNFGHRQEPRPDSQFRLPDYFSQTEHLKHLNVPEQSSNADLLQKLNYYGQLQQLGSPNRFQQLPHFNQNQQLDQQGELEKLQNHNKIQELTSSGEHQQLNYHDMYRNSNQLQQNYPHNDQPLNKHGEFDKIENINQTQLLHNTTGEHKETNNSGMLNHPSLFEHSKYLYQNHPLNQQAELDIARQLQLQLHKSTDENQQLNYQDALNYLNHLQQQHYRNYYQQQLGNLNQPQFHNSAGEHHHINYHDNFNYPSPVQPFNNSTQDRKLAEQVELEKLGNLNSAEQHSASGGHQQLQHDGMLMHPGQFQQFNYLVQDQQHNYQGLPDNSNLTPSKLPHTSFGLQQQEHSNHSENNALSHLGDKFDHSNHLQHLINPGLFRQFIQPNQHEQDINPRHQQQIGNSAPIWQHNPPNYPVQIKHSEETGLSNYPKEVQEINYHDNEVLATGIENNSAHSEPRIEFPSYHHQHEHPHQPVNLVHLNANEKYGHPDTLPQLSSFGENRQLNQQHNVEQPQHLTEPLQIRYPRDDQQLIHHDLSGTGVPANGAVNSSDNSQLSHVPAGLQQQELSEVEKFMKLHNLSPNTNPGDAAVNPSHLSNSGQVPQPEQPDQVLHSEHLSGTQSRSHSIENHDLNSHDNRVPASGLENVSNHSKLAQIPSDLHQKYPNQSEKNTHISVPGKPDHSSHQQQFSNLGLINHPGQQFNRPEQLSQSAHSSFLHQLPNPADFWQPNQPVLFGQYKEPQHHSYSREAQLTNNDGVGVPAAGLENSAAHPELSQIPNHHYQQGYPPHTQEHRNLNVNENSRYPGYLHQLSNPVHYRQFDPLNLLPQFMYPSDPQMHGYLGQSQLPVSRDARHPETELEADATYSKTLQASNHQQQQGYPDQIANSRDPSLNEKSDSHDPQQLSNADSIQQLNQSSQYQQLNNIGMIQQLNQPSHFEEPQHSSQSRQQINSTHDQQLNISGSGIPSSNLEDTAANSNISGLINPEPQEYPDKAENFTSRNLTEQFPQVNPSDPTEKLNSSGHPEQLMQSDAPRVHANSTDDSQLTYTSQLQHADSQNPAQQLNTSGISHEHNSSSQAEHSVYGSATNLTSNQNQTLSFSEMQEIPHVQDNSNQSEHPVYRSAANLTSNQSQILNTSGISHEHDSSIQAGHPFYRSATNLTSNQSELQEHSLTDRPQQNDHPDQVKRSRNPEEPQPQINFTAYQQQNHSVFLNDNVSASEPEKSATHLQLSQPNYEGLRQEHKLENLDHPSEMGHFFRSVRPQRLNPVNQFNAPNHFMQPMSHPHPQAFPPGTQQFNYPGTGPEICYLEKTHGPCLAIIPRYFYDPVDRRCERFIFGGCEGNANNFVTLEDCETMCMMHLPKGLPANEHTQSKKPDVGYENSALPLWHPGPDLVHEVCSLEKRKGPCRALFHRYFFNSVTRSCEPFVYGGCYGNANNFFTKEECEFVCMSL